MAIECAIKNRAVLDDALSTLSKILKSRSMYSIRYSKMSGFEQRIGCVLDEDEILNDVEMPSIENGRVRKV